MTDEGDQFMVLFLAVGAICGLVWFVYREIDLARWEARSRREREAAQRAEEAKTAQERIEHLDVLNEFDLTESEAEHHPEVVEARVRQGIIGHAAPALHLSRLWGESQVCGCPKVCVAGLHGCLRTGFV
ncbi:hypothetical protein [Mycobacteroides abscessus]|uniref:hypothetical protein n=1 Tax=Mycobacteroides abscessus TaxID=36809 RepID=UPI00078CDAA5|nr:hypothetical protein [Mycobacteroides abscessus]AMU75949.1 hypothetical protein A3O06_16250 [Mycobacteroides abscessus]ANO24894.1 hypothetical protein BAB79_16250 [Mycobacteroides abscessus]